MGSFDIFHFHTKSNAQFKTKPTSLFTYLSNKPCNLSSILGYFSKNVFVSFNR